MFGNIFKKQEKTSLVNEKITIIDKKSYPKEVLEIHHEFETAAEKLLEQATEIINSQPKVNESKINLLKSLGFNQVKEVKQSSEIIKNITLSKEQIELVNYYKKQYPFNKFITEEQVQAICYKYNLVCGDVDRFKGFVPEKNLKEISNFKLKDKDKTLQGVLWGTEYTVKKRLPTINHVISITEYDNLLKNKHINGKGKKDLDGDQRWCKAHRIGKNEYLYFDNIKITKLQICAPIKDMDISGLELKEGYKLTEKHIPDPVVLQPVKGGYLILTAWGDEASDPLVINENFN